MAVTEVNLLFTGRGSGDTLANRRTYTRVYEILTDDPEDDEQVVSNGAGVPLPGDALDTDPGAVVVSIDFQQSDDDPTIWYATFEYDSEPTDPNRDRPDERVDFDGNEISKGERQANPLDEPAQWSLTNETTQEPAIEALVVDAAGNLVIPNPAAWLGAVVYPVGKYVTNGGNVYLCVSAGTSAGAGGPLAVANGIVDGTVVWNFYGTLAAVLNDPNSAIRGAILNSAAMPFDPPAMTDVSRIILTVTKNMNIGGFDYLLALKNAVNAFPWRGIPPRCARIRDVTHDGGKQLNGIFYVTTKWEIILDADTHDLRLLDQGFHEKIGYVNVVTSAAEDGHQRIKDASDEAANQPFLLDGQGRKLRPNQPPVYLRFVPRQQRIIDFNTVLPF